MPDLKLDTLRALSGNFKMLGANEIHLTGGEPLLNPQVYEFVEFLASEGFNVRMQTNGQLINQETAKRLVKSGLTNI
jgi:molybdenum cofactor biosynthesis enzyme MoaA